MKKLMYSSLIVFCLFLAACGSDSGSTTDEIKTRLIFELGSIFEVESVEIIAVEQTGTEVEPSERARIKAELSLLESLYIEDERISTYDDGRYYILNEVFDERTDFEWHGFVSSSLQGSRWSIDSIRLELMSPNQQGRPLSNWESNRIAISGTSEERELKQRLADAEESRQILLAEAEAIRQTEIEQQIKEDLEQYEVFRQKVSGQWETDSSILSRTGEFGGGGGDLQIGYLINIPKTTDLTGTLDVEIYNMDENPSKGQFGQRDEQVSFSASYTFEIGSNTFVIQEPSRFRVYGWNSGDRWAFSFDGENLRGTNRDKDSVVLTRSE